MLLYFSRAAWQPLLLAYVCLDDATNAATAEPRSYAKSTPAEHAAPGTQQNGPQNNIQPQHAAKQHAAKQHAAKQVMQPPTANSIT
jgi:hypothetical protein